MKIKLCTVLFIIFFSPLNGSTNSGTGNQEGSEKFQAESARPHFALYLDAIQESDRLNEVSYAEIAERTLLFLQQTAQDLQQKFEASFSKPVVVRFMPVPLFRDLTSAPNWANAIFYKGEIVISLPGSETSEAEFERTLRHEYVHAVVASLSGYHAPAWIDEGLAMIFEGQIPLYLADVMRDSMNSGKPLQSLARLNGGFTKMSDEQAPLAYALSYFATDKLFADHGLPAIRHYFSLLKNGQEKSEAFENAFKVKFVLFEEQLRSNLIQKFSTRETRASSPL